MYLNSPVTLHAQLLHSCRDSLIYQLAIKQTTLKQITQNYALLKINYAHHHTYVVVRTYVRG